jgi:hypothetical protein
MPKSLFGRSRSVPCQRMLQSARHHMGIVGRNKIKKRDRLSVKLINGPSQTTLSVNVDDHPGIRSSTPPVPLTCSRSLKSEPSSRRIAPRLHRHRPGAGRAARGYTSCRARGGAAQPRRRGRSRGGTGGDQGRQRPTITAHACTTASWGARVGQYVMERPSRAIESVYVDGRGVRCFVT